MNASEPANSESLRRSLDEVLAEYLSCCEAGESPNRTEWLERYPHLESELLEFFGQHDQMLLAFGAPDATVSVVPSTPRLGSRELSASQRLRQIDDKILDSEEQQKFGDYDLLEEIDRGGMGVVFKARDPKLNRIVALKMIKSGELASADEVSRFHTEAKAAAALDDPNIVPIYDSGQIEGLHFFSMAYIEGETLADRLRVAPLDVRDAVLIAKKIAAGIAYAHGKSVIHRDLKPGNILIDATGEPRITDFGLARNLNQDDRLTVAGQILGTPAYMPPEQARGMQSQVTPASDVYSIGAILYACLTGQAPHTSTNTLDVLLKVQESDPQPPWQLNPHVPRDLGCAVLKCLEKDPEKRYGSAAELEEDLSRFLRDEPMEGGRVTLPNLLHRWSRREPALVAHWVGIGTIFFIATVFAFIHNDWAYYSRHGLTMFVWAALCYPLERLIRIPGWERKIRSIWGTLDVVTFTLILHMVDPPPRTPYLIGYPFIIAASGLWGKSSFVMSMTVQCILAYFVLCYLHTEELIPTNSGPEAVIQSRIHYPVFFTAGLFVMGLVIRAQVKRLRALSRYFEVQNY